MQLRQLVDESLQLTQGDSQLLHTPKDKYYVSTQEEQLLLL